VAPGRIVSLVPSLSETLFVLGVGSRVVGRTRYCTDPPRVVGRIPKVGGTKKVDVIRALSLEPLAALVLPLATYLVRSV
jgi:ABC-type hemin transport system substrate-binding protein